MRPTSPTPTELFRIRYRLLTSRKHGLRLIGSSRTPSKDLHRSQHFQMAAKNDSVPKGRIVPATPATSRFATKGNKEGQRKQALFVARRYPMSNGLFLPKKFVLAKCLDRAEYPIPPILVVLCCECLTGARHRSSCLTKIVVQVSANRIL